MQITKIGHCCLLIKDQGKTILTDPGAFSTGQNSLTNIDLVLITHEHHDHLHIDSLKAVLANNPQAIIITNSAVGKILEKDDIPYQLLEDGQSGNFKGLDLQGFGSKHAVVHSSIPIVQNTGYMICGRLCYPGDAFEMPKDRPEIIALPVAGPWMKISEAIDYALALKPKFVFPVHDAILSSAASFMGPMVSGILKPQTIDFLDASKLGEMNF